MHLPPHPPPPVPSEGLREYVLNQGDTIRLPLQGAQERPSSAPRGRRESARPGSFCSTGRDRPREPATPGRELQQRPERNATGAHREETDSTPGDPASAGTLPEAME